MEPIEVPTPVILKRDTEETGHLLVWVGHTFKVILRTKSP